MITANRTVWRSWGAAFVMVLVSALSARGQGIPDAINYQGILTDISGTPLVSGSYSLEFRVYSDARGGTLVWGPQVFDGDTVTTGHVGRVAVVNGFYGIALGPEDTEGRSIVQALAGPNRYLEVTLQGSLPIQPRQQIVSVPYALAAMDADALQDDALTADTAANQIKVAAGRNLVLPSGSIRATSGVVRGQSLSGGGAGVTGLNASALATGQMAAARLPETIHVSGTITAGSVSGDGAGLVNLSGSDFNSGTVANARLPQSFTISGTVTAGRLVGEGSGLTGLSGANLTNVDASKFTTGQIDNARLPSTINQPSVQVGKMAVGSAIALPGAQDLVVEKQLGVRGEPAYDLHIVHTAAIPNVNMMIEPAAWSAAGNFVEIWLGGAAHKIRGEYNAGLSFHSSDGFTFDATAFKVDASDWMQVRQYSFSTTTYNTGYSASNWDACVVGYQFLEGDWHENTTGDLLVAYMGENNGNWTIYTAIMTHSAISKKIDVLFIRKELSNRL